MYYVIRDSGVISGRNLAAINRILNADFQDDEFQIVGADRIIRCDNTDIDFVRDKKKMENILFSNFFKKDNSLKFMLIINTILTFVILVMIANLGG